ncbi:hypothetical protein DFH08DRAFT_808292 [Mycena albidolilacea]|uniref:Uncharacterized protein n=1 Tax=Mycena albidolilacea TaxID=1033008 RepID=A0AAD7A335_9AGAR|nr:hypothetical protein DFH08DRAFT_808292 [Mycena albidolilacea]
MGHWRHYRGAIEGGIIDVVWTAGGVLVGGTVEGGIADVVCMAGGAVAGGTRGGDPGLWIQGGGCTVVKHGAGSRQVQAGSGQGTPNALTSIVWWLGKRGIVEVSRGCCGRWKEEERMLVWRVLQLSFSFKLRREAVSRGQCLSQKGSGAEAVCLECWDSPTSFFDKRVPFLIPSTMGLTEEIGLGRPLPSVPLTPPITQ